MVFAFGAKSEAAEIAVSATAGVIRAVPMPMASKAVAERKRVNMCGQG